MKSLLLIFFICFVKISRQECPKRTEVVCNWGSWALYRDGPAKFLTEHIDPSLCTNIVYTFIGLNLQLEIDSLDSWADRNQGGFKNLTALKTKYPCLKTTLAIGGWDEGSIKYSVIAYTEETRNKFAEELLNFLAYYGFDGVDLDWDYPTTRGGLPADKINFPLLLKAIKEKISPWGYSLSISVGAQEELLTKAYDTKAISETVDYIHLMAYDFTSSISPTIGLSAALSEVKKAVESWLEDIDPKKLILGLQCYGRAFILEDPTRHLPGDPSAGSGYPGIYTKEEGFLAYYEVLDSLDNGMIQMVDDGTNYAYYDTDWITYENDDTIALKVNYALEKNLAGVMLWSIDLDDFQGQFGRKFPILHKINDVINQKKL